MKRYMFSVLFLSAVSTAPAHASSSQERMILGSIFGGAIGAVIGHDAGGRDGAILGSAIGAATGTALTTRHERAPQVVYNERIIYRDVYRDDRHDYYRDDRGLHRGHHKHKRHHRHRHHDHDD